MDERRVHIDEFFRRQMDDHAETPPLAVWDALEKRLDNPPGRKKPFPVWWFWTIAGLIFLSATVIIAGYLNKAPEYIAQQAATTPVPTTTPAAEEEPMQETIAETATEKKPTTNTLAPVVAPSATGQKNNPSTTKAKANNEQQIQETTNNTQVGKTSKPKENINAISNNNIQQLRNTNNIVHNSPDATPLPAIAKHKDAVQVLTANKTGNNPMDVRIANADKQGVDMPDMSKYMPEDERNGTLQLAAASVSSINTTELLASVNPMATAIAMTTPELVNITGPNANNEKQDETILPNANTQTTAPTDTTRKKKNKNADTTQSPISEPEEPVITKKKVPLPLEAGIKAGYSAGFDKNWRANKFVIAPYLEYRLPSNFSVVFQPSVQTGRAKVGAFANSNQVYKDIISNTFDSTGRVVRGKVDSSILTPNPPDTVFRTYTYGQVYDSVHVSYGVTQSQMWDIELPLLLKYKINKTFSVMAGGSVTYSSVLQTKEEVKRYQGVYKQYVETIAPETFFVTVQGQEPPPGPGRKSFENVFGTNNNSFSNYKPRQLTESNNFFRYGFMIGASATFNERWMIDLLLHKTGVDATAVPDKELHRIYTQPYLRLTVGYKLLK